jgi:hypothetical protein
MNFKFDTLPTELLAGLIGSILTFIASWLYKFWRERKGPFTGKWHQNIYDPLKDDLIVKVDHIIMRQIEENISADIKRISPTDQNERSWFFSGRFTNGQIYGHFWSKNLADPSFGTILLRQRDRFHLQGFYLKGKSKSDGWDKDINQMQVIPLEWVYVKDKDN